MLAVDTNVVARFILGDDSAQYQLAASAIADGIFLPITVLIETAWLLKSVYRQSPRQIHAALTTFLNVEGVNIRDREAVIWAIDRYGEGADLADMLHIVASLGVEGFATFDRSIAKGAGPESPLPIHTLGA